MPLIEIAKLSKVYHTADGELYALRDINLHVSKGEFAAIIGASGSGKSTLMNILGALDRPSCGSYLLNGRDMLSARGSELSKIRNREIGFIFQGFNLLPKLTAIENVELPMMYARIPRSRRRQLATQALCAVGLDGRLQHKPGEMSGGQQQRVAIARAITREPSIILADEPTGNLDRKTSDEILCLLSELHKGGATIVLITHDKNVADRAERVIEISDGKILKN